MNSKKTLMKKLFSFFVMLFVFGCGFGGFVDACDENQDICEVVSETSDVVKEFYRGRKSGDIFCEEKVRIFPEEEFMDADGVKLYSRTIEIGKEFKKESKKEDRVDAKRINGSGFESIASHKSKIKFTYDKKTFVKILDPDNDIEEEETGDPWNVMDVKEIFPEDKRCLVSTRCVLYKENRLRVREYALSSHYDVMCSVSGQIGINTELH